MVIYNNLGQIIKRRKIPEDNKIDITNLKQGLFIIELETKELTYRFKVLKE